MSKQTVRGPFSVNLTPHQEAEGVGDPQTMRMSLDKQFHGALEATSKGQMLGVRSADGASGGYVAIERVVGSLDGRDGSFVLQHSSTMHAGEQSQSIIVVPGSGTDALTGLTGSMTIEIVDGDHFYVFEYEID